MADWGEALGAGASGAGLGAAVGGPIGAGVGFLAGTAGDLLFGGKKSTPRYSDPNAGMIDSQLYRLLDSHLGEQLASRTSARVQRNANVSMQQIRNRPGMNNASVLADLYDQNQRGAESGFIDANLAGSQLDQRNRQEAMGYANQKASRDFSIGQYNQGLQDRTNALQTIGMGTAADMAGRASAPGGALSQIGKIFGGGDDSGGGGSVNTDAISSLFSSGGDSTLANLKL